MKPVAIGLITAGLVIGLTAITFGLLSTRDTGPCNAKGYDVGASVYIKDVKHNGKITAAYAVTPQICWYNVSYALIDQDCVHDNCDYITDVRTGRMTTDRNNLELRR